MVGAVLAVGFFLSALAGLLLFVAVLAFGLYLAYSLMRSRRR
jgi:hypothetical protein